jgi:OmpA-OmpF porin, OOP family
MKTKVLLASALIALSGVASAQTYGVASFGSSKQDIGCEGAATCDESGTAFKLMGGYKFNPNLALEAGFMNYGQGS